MKRAALAPLLALAAACASTPAPLGEQPFAPPRATRVAGLDRTAETLEPKGPIGPADFKLEDALERVDHVRDPAGDDVHFVVREALGWRVYAFDPKRLERITLREIEVAGLPLAADPDAPQTYVVDATGAVGRLARAGDGYALERLDAPPASQPGARPIVTGFVVPASPMTNHATNVAWSPAYVFRPGSSLPALADGLQWMSAHLPRGIEIRAVGSRHSWSRVAETAGVTVIPDDWRGLEVVAAATSDSGALVRVLAGTTIRDINHELAARDLAIPYLGGFDGQTLGGVLATGTHGSVGSLGPLADLIRSIDLVCFDGRVMRIEPARRRVTDPDALARATAPGSRRIELRVDDELFDATRVGLGTFGVIHSLVIETAPKYWLQEVRTVVAFEEVRRKTAEGRIRGLFEPRDYVLARLRNRDLADFVAPPPGPSGFDGHPAPAFHLEFLWNPYGDGKTLVTSRHWVDAATRASFERSEPAKFGEPPSRELLRSLDPRTMRFTRPGAVELLAAHVGAPATALVELLQKDAPRAVPELLDASIVSLVDRGGYVRRSYDVFNIGDHTNQLPSLSATVSVPLRDDLWLRAVDVIHRNSETLLETGLVETSPISLRFVAGSTALLGDPEDVCKFELIFAGNGETARAQASAIVASHWAALRAELGDVVRLHFGQLIPPATLDRAGSDGRFPVETAFPKYATWRRLRDELDPDGHGLTPWLRSILPPAR